MKTEFHSFNFAWFIVELLTTTALHNCMYTKEMKGCNFAEFPKQNHFSLNHRSHVF